MRPFALTLAVFSVCLAAARAHAASIHFTDPTPAELKMTADPKAPGAPAVILSYEESDDANSAEVLVHMRIKVLTSGGISAANIQIPDRIISNDEWSQLFIARTIQPDGRMILFERSAANTTVTHDSDNEPHKVIAMPDVQVGSIVEYAYRLDGLNTLFTTLARFYAPVWRVQQNYYIHAAHFSLKAPDDLPPESTRWVANLPTEVSVKHVRSNVTLDLGDIPAAPDEPFMPPSGTALFNVRFFYYSGTRDKFWGVTGDSVDTEWSAFDKPTKGLTAAAQTLIQPADTDQQKLRKLYLAVQQLENTDYTRRRSVREDKQAGYREAKSSEDIWNRKRGDAEDITHLFVALARGAGFSAYPMAVSSRGHAVFDQNVLSWSQMDSLVAVINLGDRTVYLDPGVRYCAFGDLAPWHSNAGSVSPQGKLVKFPVTFAGSAAASRTDRLVEMTMAADGTVSGAIRMTWVRNAGLPLRGQALREDSHAVETSLDKQIQEMIPEGIDAHLKKLTGLSDGETDLVAEFSVSGKFRGGTAKRVILPVQFFAARDVARFVAQTRTQPIAFPDTYMVRDQMVLHLPVQLATESLPETNRLAMEKDSAYVGGVQPSAKDPHVLVAQRTFVLNRLDFKPEDYPAVKKYFDRIATSDQDRIVLKAATVQ